MARYKLVVLYNAAEGKDREFNEWLDDIHIPELLQIAEIKAADRFRLALTQGQPAGEMSHQYMTLYDIETDDIEAFHEMLMETRKDRVPTDAVDRPYNSTRYFAALGDIRLTSAD